MDAPLVAAVNDTRLAERFADLGARLPQPAGPHAVGNSMLLHDLDSPLGTQLSDANLSHAELTLRAGAGKVELVAVAQHAPDAVRSGFEPPGVGIEAREGAEVRDSNLPAGEESDSRHIVEPIHAADKRSVAFHRDLQEWVTVVHWSTPQSMASMGSTRHSQTRGKRCSSNGGCAFLDWRSAG